jgi:hypothetical protein
MTMSWGYHYNEGKRVGYNISFSNNNGTFVLHNVAASDKSRIIKEVKQAGYTADEIDVERVEL